MDACCGVGGASMQFAKYSDFCIGVDIDSKKIGFARENSKKFGVSSNCDFIISDFFKLT